MNKQKETPQTEVTPVRTKASTQDILGAAPRRIRVDPQWLEHYQRLCRLKDQFLKDKQALSMDAKAPVASSGEHMADAATDAYERDWAMAMISSEQQVLLEIEQALRRIAQGSYGTCELNGELIEPERLLTIPWTRFSARAQRELETNGTINRTHLGQAGTCFQAADASEATEDEPEETPKGGRGRHE